MTAATADTAEEIGTQPRPRPDGPAAVDAVPLAGRRRARRLVDPRRTRDPDRRAQRCARSPTRDARAVARRRSATSARPTSSGRSSARCSSAGSPTRSAASGCSSSRWPSTSIGSGLGGFSWDFWSLMVFRFIAGTGIGGEYTAINSAIDEMIPSQVPRPRRHRGQRHLLGRRGARLGCRAVPVQHRLRPDRLGVAHRLLHRPGARPDHHLHPSDDSGEPALADDPRPQRRGRAHRRRDRGARQARRASRLEAGRREQGDGGHRPTASRLLRTDQDLLRRRTRSARSTASR